MLTRFLSLSVLAIAMAGGAAAQTNTMPSTSTPGVVVTAPDANAGRATATPLPGVTDPTTTNSTTGTVDQEDRCQAPGTQPNTNPSAEIPTLPRAEPACR